MDWNLKFSSIIKETESNLAKVKERLHSTQSPEYISETKGSALQNLYTNSNNPLGYTDGGLCGPLTKHHSSLTPFIPYNSQVNDSYLTNVGKTTYSEDIQKYDNGSSGMITLLHDKIDAQSKTIEILLLTVKNIEQERNEYSRQVKELRDDMAQLTNRVMERGIDIQTERKIEQWKQDVTSQISALQSQIKVVNNWSEKNGSYHDNQTTNVIRDLHELKRIVSTECDGLRYSIESVKNRLGRLEVDLNSTSIENRSIAQRQTFIDTNMRSFLDVQTTPPLFSSRASNDLQQLKSSINTIQHRLGYMENDLKKSNSFVGSGTWQRQKTKTRKKYTQGSTNIISPETSDLDLSDSFNLGTAIEKPLSYRNKSRQSNFDDLDNTVDLSADELNTTHDELDDVRTADLEDVITANTVDLNITDDDGLDDDYLEHELVNDHELSIDELN